MRQMVAPSLQGQRQLTLQKMPMRAGMALLMVVRQSMCRCCLKYFLMFPLEVLKPLSPE